MTAADRDSLAALIRDEAARDEVTWCKDGECCLDRGREAADAILASDWLAAHDAEMTARALAPVLALHRPEKRYHGRYNDESSFDTPEEAAEWDNSDPADVSMFEVCAECGQIETAEDQRDPGFVPSFLNAMWPCATVKALDSAAADDHDRHTAARAWDEGAVAGMAREDGEMPDNPYRDTTEATP